MTSLYYVTEHIKLVGKWVGIIIVSIIAIIFLFRFIFFIKELIAPTPLPPPTVTWGKLPPLVFPDSQYIQTFTYKVNTLSGELPNLPDRLTVNLLATPEASLQSLGNAKDVIQGAGFEQEEIRISESTYQWINPDPPGQKLQYDIVSKNFTLASNYLFDQEILAGEQLPDDIDAKNTAENFLALLNVFPSDFEATKSSVTFFAIQNAGLIKTTSLSNAQVIRTDFFQKDVNNIPIYYPEYPLSPTYVLVTGGYGGGSIVEAKYMHHTITDISSTYPIMTANEAFELLKRGEGYVALYQGTNTDILIQDVKLGYYLDKDTNTYLMPIIIFEGNNNFVAFVSAIKGQWINK